MSITIGHRPLHEVHEWLLHGLEFKLDKVSVEQSIRHFVLILFEQFLNLPCVRARRYVVIPVWLLSEVLCKGVFLAGLSNLPLASFSWVHPLLEERILEFLEESFPNLVHKTAVKESSS